MSISTTATPSGVTAADVVQRLERLPISLWQVKTRVIVGVATFFDAFDALAIAFVLPVLVPLWKLTPGQIGLMISVGFLGQLIGALFFGWVAERFGRLPAITWSVALFAVMSFACAFAWSYESLLVLRTLQGIGLGGEVPVAAVYISEIARAKGRGRFFLLYELIFPIGLLMAGVVGAWVVPTYGWQAMFYIGAVPALLALVLRLLLPESPRWLASRGRMTEANAALSRIERETEKASGQPLPPPQPVKAQVANISGSWRDLFGTIYLRRTLVIWVIWFATYLVNYGIVTWLPTLYRTVYKLPLDLSLRYSLVTNAVGLIGCAVCAFLIDRVGRRAWISAAFFGASVFLLALWMHGAGSAESVLLLGSAAYFFISTLSISVYLFTPESYPTRVRAIGVSTATAWLRLASIIGPTIVGAMVAGSGLASVFLTFGTVTIIAGIIVALFAVETTERVLEEASP